NDETKNLINKNSLKKCKNGVRIINCARGGIVNEMDLLEALKSGKVAAAALDTFSKEPPTPEIVELLKHPAVICTPHLGANTSEAQSKVAQDIAVQFVNALDYNEYLGVVNAGYIGLSKQAHMIQYLDLSERLGSMLGQILDGSVKKLTLNLYGKELSKDQVADIICNSALKGLLNHVVEDSVNLINAPYLAEEHGLKIKVNRFDQIERGQFNDTIELVLETDISKHSLVGTVYHGETIRVVKIDDFKVEFNPIGNILMFWNNDKPGVIAAVSSAMSSINIADMSLGRFQNSAFGVITTDEIVGLDIIDNLINLHNIKKIKRLKLVPKQSSLSKTDEDDRPVNKPSNPNFGSGPCTKRPGYELSNLPTNLLGRSHRSSLGKARIKKATEEAKRILRIPDNYSIGIVPASDTGAVEMAMWGLLSHESEVDVVVMDAFGKDWYVDAAQELKLKVNKFESDYGKLPDLIKVNTKKNDVVFTWNGTTSGVKIPHGNWIADDREGLTICDATSAAFAMHLPWEKLDVTTFSWQKVLGGEAAHGILIASPRAIERFHKFKNNRPWPMPKIFRFSPDIFTGNVINTPSMLCIEDFLDALKWADSIGGLEALIQKSNENLAVIENFVKENNWIRFLAEDSSIRSNTSICLTLDLELEKLKKMLKILEKEEVAFDIGSYKSAPPGIRIWGGATVSKKDLHVLTNWLKWAYENVNNTEN
ncbi:MAG: phosphoserine transaminase, partial [Chlamydiae bacterium]|nr:phosphoserine transaminase [Chlamydiota bacterium]